MAVLLGRHLGPELVRILGLPKNTVSFDLRCAVDEAVTVRCEFFPDVSNPDELVAVFRSYRLERGAKFQLSARAGCSDEVRDDFNAWLLERFGYEEQTA